MEDVNTRPKETVTQTTLPQVTEVDSGEILLSKTRALLTEWKQVNAERKELLDREERMHAERLLGGQSMAGTPTLSAINPEEERANELKRKIFETMGRKAPE